MHASYEGTVNGNGTEIGGKWSWLGQSQPLGLKRATPQAAVKPAPPSDIDGTRMGTLSAEDVQVHTLFKIANTSAGLTAEWQSPDRSPTWVFATAIKRNGPSLTIEVKGIGATRMCLKLARVADKLHPTIDGPILEGLPFFGRGLRKN